MSFLKKIKYPKLILLTLTFVLAYFLFQARNFSGFFNFISATSYLGVFVAGLMFTYGFTTAPATAILLILAKEQNIFLASAIAGVGALLSDLVIFHYVKTSLSDEFKKLAREKMVSFIDHKMPFKKYMLPVIAGLIIASPLPDELGVILLANSHGISTKVFSIIAYTFNTMGIFIILLIGNTL